MSESIYIKIPQLNRCLVLSKGSNLFRALRDAGIPIGNACAGEGVCGQCHLQIEPKQASTPCSALEKSLYKSHNILPNERVSCLLRVHKSATIRSRYWG